MKDTELVVLRYTRYAHLSDAQAHQTIAKELGLNPDSVRGRINRADTTSFVSALKTHTEQSPRMQVKMSELISTPDTSGVGLFISDAHWPHTRFDALELAVKIAKAAGVTYASGFNDFFEHADYGRWPDKRNAHDKTLTANLSRAIQAKKLYMKAFGKIQWIAIMGNHDLWLNNYLHEKAPTLADDLIYDMMLELSEVGMIFTELPYRQNVVQLNEHTAWTHGWYAHKNVVTSAQNTILDVQRALNTRVTLDVVSGHTHRQITVPYGRATHYVSGCMRNLDPDFMPYNDHTLGVVISYPTHNVPVPFTQTSTGLMAQLNGVTYYV